MSDYDPNYVPRKTYFLVGGKAVVFNKDEKILILQRSKKAGGGGKWSLPGGALEKDENPIESIKREIMEETKLKVTGIKPFSFKTYEHKDDHILIIGYKCRTSSNKIVLDWEHDDYEWLTKDDALKLDLTEGGRHFLEYA